MAYSLRLIYIAFFNFPSFLLDNIFKEEKNFFIPLFFLYFFCTFSGNFFFYYFFPCLSFSFLDFFIGVIIIISGLALFFISFNSYFLKNFFIRVSFIFYFFSSYFSQFFFWFPYKIDYSWREIFGGKGVLLFLGLVKIINFKFYLLRFIYVFFIILLFFLMFNFYYV
jgi:hypothetical protein